MTMDNDKLTNYNERNIESVDGFLCDDGESRCFLQRTYAMIQTGARNPVVITKESRRKCAESLVR